VEYAGGTFALTASVNNYIYLNTAASCTPAVKTSTFTASDIPIATVVAGASTITTIDDNRTPFLIPSATTLASAVTGSDSSSTANVYVVTLNPTPLSVPVGMIVNFIPHAANTTTTPTLTVAPGSAAVLTKTAGAVLAANDMLTTVVARAQWNGAGWTLLNAQTSSGGGGISALTSDVAAAGTGSVSATVQGLKSVPFCTGYTPTNGQVPEFITTSSPNPCYGAVTPGLPAGVSSDSNNGLIVSGSSQVGTLQKTYKCVGADPTDGNAINTMLANGAGVYLTLVGNCVDNTVVIKIQSGQTIDGGRAATIAFTPSSVPSPIWTGLLTNTSANEAATRTFSDAVTTAGSKVMTSATAAFVAADVTQGITCTGLLGSSITEGGVTIPNLFSTVIQSVESGTQINTVDPIPLSTTGTSCSIYYRDSHITLRGLKLMNNGPNCGAGNNDNWWVTVFMHVNGLVEENVEFQDGTTGATSGNGCKQELFSDSSNIRLVNNSCLTWNIFEDCYDFFGNVKDVEANGQHGITGDDTFAIQSSTNEFVSTFPFQGPMSNFTISNNNVGSATAILKLYGPDQLGYLPNTNISLINTKCPQAVPGAVSNVQSGYRGFLNVGGTQDTITVDGMSGFCGIPVNLNGNLTNGIFRDISVDPASITTATRLVYIQANAYQTAPVYTNLSFEQLKYSATSIPEPLIQATDIGAIFSNIKIDGFQVPNATPASSSQYFIVMNFASMNQLVISRLGINYASAAAANAPTIYLGPATGSSQTISVGSISLLDSNFNIAAGTNGPYPLLQVMNPSTSPIITFMRNTLSSATASTNGYLVAVTSTGTPGTLGTPTFHFQNNVLTNMTGCVLRLPFTTTNVFLPNYPGVTAINNIFPASTTCPANSQLLASSIVGTTTQVGQHNGYDKETLAGVGLSIYNNPTTAITGGAGGLLDNTLYYYRICSENSQGGNCGAEKTVTVCPVATYPSGCSNASTVSIAITTQGADAQSYNVYRGTAANGELLCSSLTGVSVALSSITDAGGTCSGAAYPTTNTSIPTFTMANASGTQSTTISGSASTSAISVAMPSVSGSTLAVTSQLSSIRAGAWSISAGTTVAVTFGTAMSATPASCQLTTSASTATTGAPFASSLATTGFTVNVPVSGTIAGTYLCTVNGTN